MSFFSLFPYATPTSNIDLIKHKREADFSTTVGIFPAGGRWGGEEVKTIVKFSLLRRFNKQSINTVFAKSIE
jgi:hypothetical protein